MTTYLHSILPCLVPKAIAWAERISQQVAEQGATLTERGISIARRVGVLHPELIRIATVPTIPLPDDPQLLEMATATGLHLKKAAGLTLGYSILIVEGRMSVRLASHECRHVVQYEEAGSIAAFLPGYLKQLADVGYENAPYEIDAKAHEFDS